MFVRCTSCGSRFKFDPDQIKADQVKVKCPNCKESLIIHKPEKEPPPQTQPEPEPEPTAAPEEDDGILLALTTEDIQVFVVNLSLNLRMLEESDGAIEAWRAELAASVQTPGAAPSPEPVTVELTAEPQPVVASLAAEDEVVPVEMIKPLYDEVLDLRAYDDSFRVTDKGAEKPVGNVDAPVLSPEPGDFTGPQRVTISCPTEGAAIYYTIDGIEPDTKSTRYVEPITVSSSALLKAKAFKSQFVPSLTVIGNYTITGTVDTPSLSPEAGTYSAPQSVTISCTTSGAVIRYTTDGSRPDKKSPVYKTPIQITEPTTIKARAFKSRWTPSPTVEKNYDITGAVAAPSLSLKTGTYTTPQKVTISCPTPEAAIHYTTDGSEPDQKAPVYSSPIPVPQTITIKAMAFKPGWEPSPAVEETYTITGIVDTPVLSPPPGAYSKPQQVNLSCSAPEASIHFTVDGNEPGERSPVYSGPINVSASINLKAKAFRPHWWSSDTAEGFYNITGEVTAPVITPRGGIYTRPQSVSLSCSTPGAVIQYTLDRSEPSPGSPIYSGPLEVSQEAVLRARAFKPDWEPSQTVQESYTITGTVETPVISFPGGIYTRPQSVSLSCSTPGAVIQYTLDRSEPSPGSPIYSGPLEVSQEAVLRARAFKPDWEPSQTVQESYTITGTVETPVISFPGGIYTRPQGVSISCSTPGAVIQYTLDRSEPSPGSPIYSGPLEISQETVLRARAFKPDWEPSTTVQESYTITGTVEAPVISLPSGIYIPPQGVSISCITPGAVIHYTLDRSDPGEGSPIYSGPLEISQETVLKARAFKPDWEPSQTVQESYTIAGTVKAPVISPPGGIYTRPQKVSLSCDTPEAVIHYTLDGSEPSPGSLIYSGPLDVSQEAVIKARAFRSDWEPSQMVQASYNITGTVEPPVISLPSGIYIPPQGVSISCSTPGAVIHYTLDGSEPSPGSLIYSGPVEVSQEAVLKARAFKPDWEPSQTVQETYTITGTVEAPVISPPGRIYTRPQSVSLSCSTPGAVIHYTSDGSEPSPGSLIYSGPLEVSEEAVLKAKAFKPDWEPSQTVQESYTITGTVEAPVISLLGGIYIQPQSVSLSCDTPEAVIHYTLDQSEPSPGSLIYSGPLEVSEEAVLKARAFKPDWAPSPTVQESYTITGTVEAPVISLPGGIYIQPQSITLSCSTPEAVIHYTLDGSEPSPGSLIYSGPLDVSQEVVLKARAFKPDWEPSQTVQESYTITGTVEAPVISPPGGIYIRPQSVSLSCDTLEAVIHYTLDGSEPSPGSLIYSGPIEVSQDAVLKARAFKPDWEPSQTVQESYTITGTVEAPVISPPGGIYIRPQSVSLSCDTPEAVIHYTLDGSEPSPGSLIYSGPIEVSQDAVLKARAFKPDWEPSQTVQESYTITGTVEEPVISPPGGIYIRPQSISLSCDTPEAVIHYTLDGSEPSHGSLIYSGPVEVSEEAVLKARAFKPDWEPSQTVQESYTITGTVEAPVISPPGGIYIRPQSVSLSCSTSSADIHYTLDQSEPSSGSLIYSGPVDISQDAVLKARAYKPDWEPSQTAQESYTITGTVEAPVISLRGGVYIRPQSISLSCGTPEAIIHYTLDQSEPSSGSLIYSGPVDISQDAVLKARAYKPDWEPSQTAQESYTITGTVEAPVISLRGGIYTRRQSVSLSCSTRGAVIHYTLDQSEPAPGSLIYSGPVEVSQDAVLKARAFKPDWEPSPTVQESYTITGTVEAPVISPPGGIYIRRQSVSLSCGTPGAVIRYTRDRSEPAPGSLIYAGPLDISQDAVLKAKAFKPDWGPSPAVQESYTITGTVEALVISPSGGIYIRPQNVSLSCSTPGAVIHYTLDRSEPSPGSLVYSGPVEISQDAVLKARAYKPDWEPSRTVQESYTITGTVETPILSPRAGTYTTPQSVSISCATQGVTIRYTADGREPDERSAEYSSAIQVAGSTTIKAKAFKPDWELSQTSTGIYTITGAVAAPSFTPSPGAYEVEQVVSMACSTPGATIYFTMDGSEPDESSPIFIDPVPLFGPAVIKARAYRSGWNPSEAAVGEYTVRITEATLAPEAFPPPVEAAIEQELKPSEAPGEEIAEPSAPPAEAPVEGEVTEEIVEPAETVPVEEIEAAVAEEIPEVEPEEKIETVEPEPSEALEETPPVTPVTPEEEVEEYRGEVYPAEPSEEEHEVSFQEELVTAEPEEPVETVVGLEAEQVEPPVSAEEAGEAMPEAPIPVIETRKEPVPEPVAVRPVPAAEPVAAAVVREKAPPEVKVYKPSVKDRINFRYVILGIVILVIAAGAAVFAPGLIKDYQQQSDLKVAVQGYEAVKKIESAVRSGKDFPDYKQAVDEVRLLLNRLSGPTEKLAELKNIFMYYDLANQVWEHEWLKDENKLAAAYKNICPLVDPLEKEGLPADLARLVREMKPACQPDYFQGLYPQGLDTPPRPQKDQRELTNETTRRFLWGWASGLMTKYEKGMQTGK